jgi:hypothetical protein
VFLIPRFRSPPLPRAPTPAPATTKRKPQGREGRGGGWRLQKAGIGRFSLRPPDGAQAQVVPPVSTRHRSSVSTLSMRIKLFPHTRFGWIRLTVLLLLPLVGIGVVLAIGVPMPGSSFDGPLPPLTGPQRESADRLRVTVFELAGRIGRRNFIRYAELRESEEFLRASLTELGYEVHRQTYEAGGLEFVNLEVLLSGDSTRSGCLVVGAHYDSVYGSPGADDNASGTAALLELARLLSERSFHRPLRLAFFVNEEPPYFQTDAMGSRVYALELAKQRIEVAAMLSLESIGCFSSEPGSQHYPFPLHFLYPDTGDFIGFVGNHDSRALVRRVIGVFRRETAFPSEGLAVPDVIPGVGWSDHWSFWQEGWPALMVTDTALFRNPTYHEPTDTPDTLDYEAMARIVHGLVAVIEELDD